MKAHLVVGVIERDGTTLYCSTLFFAPMARWSANTAS
jgi:nitrilase